MKYKWDQGFSKLTTAVRGPLLHAEHCACSLAMQPPSTSPITLGIKPLQVPCSWFWEAMPRGHVTRETYGGTRTCSRGAQRRDSAKHPKCNAMEERETHTQTNMHAGTREYKLLFDGGLSKRYPPLGFRSEKICLFINQLEPSIPHLSF